MTSWLGADPTLLLSAVAAATLLAGLTARHSPHDVVADVSVVRGRGGRRSVFVISRHNLLRSDDDGPWKRLTAGLGAWKLSSLVVSPAFAADQTLFAASFGGGVFRSTDGGRSWTSCNGGLQSRDILLMGLEPEFPATRGVYALCRGGEVFRSADAGDSWRRILASPHAREAGPDPGQAILLDPFRDAGEAWSACFQTTGATCIAFTRDAVLVGTSDGELMASRDHGASWSSLGRLPQGVRITCLEAPDTQGLGRHVYVGTDGAGLFRVRSDGAGVEPLPAPAALARVTALGSFVDASGQLVLAACGWRDGLLLSDDGGRTWRLAADGATRHPQADETRYGAPHFSALGIDASTDAPELYLGGFDGLFHSQRPGAGWTSIETLPLGIVLGLDMAPGHDGPAVAVSTYGAGVYLSGQKAGWEVRNQGLPTLRLGPIAFAPAPQRTLFVGSEGCILRGAPGQAWRAAPLRPARRSGAATGVYAWLRRIERYVSARLDLRSMKALKRLFQAGALRVAGRVSRFVFPTSLAFAPGLAEGKVLLAGTRAHGVFRSDDGGESFRQVWDGGGDFVSGLVVLPSSGTALAMLAALPDGIHLSEDGGMSWVRVASESPLRGARLAVGQGGDGAAVVFAGGREGLYRSDDRGTSWHGLDLGAGGSPPAIGGLAVSPDFANDGGVLVHVHGASLRCSWDGGRSFQPVPWPVSDQDQAMTPPHCFPDSATLFRFSPDFARDGAICAASFDTLYLSRDRGGSWSRVRLPTRYESARAEIAYQGRWRVAEGEAFSAGRAHHSRFPGDTARLGLLGDRVAWIGSRGPDHGQADVLVDGVVRAGVDLYAPQPEFGARLCELDLGPGRHELTIRVRGSHDPRATAAEVWIDAIDVGEAAVEPL